MEEIKTLVNAVAGLPNAALWVVAAFLIFKLAGYASIYGVLRIAIIKGHDWAVTKKAREIEYKEIRPMLDGITITGGTTEALIAQLHRVVGKNVGIDTRYIHKQSIEWLRQAIDDKIDKDRKESNDG